MAADQSIGLQIVRSHLRYLVKNFCLSTRKFDEVRLKELKNFVRRNQPVIFNFIKELLVFLKQPFVEIRIAVLLICDEFFQRSHVFRLELSNRLHDFLVLSAEISPMQVSLPFSRKDSIILKSETFRIVKSWHEKFSAAYPKLQHSFAVLLACGIDQSSTTHETQENEINRRKRAKARFVVAEITKEFNDSRGDIMRCIRETHCALELLVPKFESEKSRTANTVMKSLDDRPLLDTLHGYVSSDTISITIPLEAPVLTRNQANEALIDSLNDCLKMLRYFENLITKWLLKLTKYGCEGEMVIRDAIETRAKLKSEIGKCEELKLSKYSMRSRYSSDSDSDDFEDVPEKEGYEPNFKMPYEVPPYVMSRIEKQSQLPLTEHFVHGRDNGSSEVGPSKANVPILPFGLDLKYWGERDIRPAEIPLNCYDCHPFWRATKDSNEIVRDSVEVYHSRLITYVGPKLTVQQCRAPRKDGSLCPRKEHRKCPIHGLIIERDEMGYPVEQQPLVQKRSSAMMDNEFLKDIERAIGVNLSDKTKYRSRRKDMMNDGSEVRRRLSTKLFNRRSLKRISETLDSIRKAKAAKNFQHQFNYAVSNH
ncbi:unnamed protein product [Dracunculus medinensis]|uniref:UV-stimulated scaffold protein A n=1 Tax=Dracunculus medinensis TaxID=318479 RepID=A0A0N4UH94_DRAME|nr:unnamed protein product [Dracunculus medinensis]